MNLRQGPGRLMYKETKNAVSFRLALFNNKDVKSVSRKKRENIFQMEGYYLVYIIQLAPTKNVHILKVRQLWTKLIN